MQLRIISFLFNVVLALSVWDARAKTEISFSGYKWDVKDSGNQQWGPGPNYFSPDSRNVWVDEQGRLHLKITFRQNRWYCAEVISQRSFGFGSYRWRVSNLFPAGELDANVVLGLFTWSDRPEFANREIDVAVARWGKKELQSNSQYVTQPYTSSGHLKRFTTSSVANVTHGFTWKEDRVDFFSEWESSPSGAQSETWSFVKGSLPTAIIPQPFDENARMNLWLFRSFEPFSLTDVEIVLESFSFTPLSPSSPSSSSSSSTYSTKSTQSTFILPFEQEDGR